MLWSIKGDLDWYSKGLGLKNYNSNEPCEYCPVSRGGPKEMWPTNYASDAPWKRRHGTDHEWRVQNGNTHALLSTFSWLSMHNLEAAELHILHLGVSQYYIGSILWLLTYKNPAGTPADNFEKAWGRFWISTG